MLTTGVPECHDFEVLSSRTVIDEVSCSGQVQTTGFGIPCVLDTCSYAWLLDQCFKRGLQVRTDCSGRYGAVLFPPSRGSLDLPLSPGLDAYGQRQVSVVLTKLLEEFVSGNPFVTVGFIQSLFELRLEGRG